EFDPNEDPDEEEFNPNDEEPEEIPKEEEFNPNDENPNEVPDPLGPDDLNPSNTGTVTVIVSEESEHEPEQNPEDESEHEPETEPEQVPEEEQDDNPDELVFVSPEGTPMPSTGNPEIEQMKDDIQEIMEDVYGPESESESDIETEAIPDFEPELKSEEEANDSLEEQWELVSPEGEPITPIEEAIKNLYEPEQESDNEPEEKFEVILEQEPESIPNHEPDLIPEKAPEKTLEKTLKKKRIKAKDFELITDPEELGDYKPYEYQRIVKTKYDPIFHEKQTNKPKEKHPKSKKKKSKKIKDLPIVTHPEELGKVPNYGDSQSVQDQVKKSDFKKESRPVHTNKSEVEGKTKVNGESNTAQGEVSKKSEIETEKSKKQVQQQKHENGKSIELEKESEKQIQEQELRQKYHRETGKRPIYNKIETKGFLAWLEKQWEILLKKWIIEANEREISKEIKKELINLIETYQTFRKIYLQLINLLKKKNLTNKHNEDIENLLKRLEKIDLVQAAIFRNLGAFRLLYNQHNIWNMDTILKEREKFVKFLCRKLKFIKNAERNWKEVLKEKLYKNTTLTLKEKSQIIKILQNEELNETNRNNLVILLSKLPVEELISLLGNKFEQHIKHYIKWGRDFYQNFKIKILHDFFIKCSYSILEFIVDLRKAIQDILPKNELLYGKRLTYRKLSKYLGQKENHLYFIIKNVKRNPKFQLNLTLLGEYKKKLISRFGSNCKEALALIEKYKHLNRLRQQFAHIYNYHPNIKLDYFRNIDTLEKAYWLGFIYADGCLSYSEKIYIRFVFELDIKDKDSRDKVYLLAKILGIEPKYVKPSSRGNTLRIVIKNNILAGYLKNQGVIIGKRKSKNIELPDLGSRALNLAFLLGYYDGDGTAGSTVIYSGSKKFLEQIKTKYKINYDLKYKRSESIINGKEVKGEAWSLALGAKLFNEMMRNYQFSMPRKRKIFETQEEKSERMRQTCIARAKLKITDDFLDKLKKLVWEMPLYKIASKFNISNSRISDICKQYKIDKPPIGYWKSDQNKR
ncbi:MAG: hypothetical protein ACFFG0_27065, partial [Candidatus Thorarchaeota archaeon]